MWCRKPPPAPPAETRRWTAPTLHRLSTTESKSKESFYKTKKIFFFFTTDVRSTTTYLGRPSNIGHKYWLHHFSRALHQVLSDWRGLLTQTGWGEIRAIVGNHLKTDLFNYCQNYFTLDFCRCDHETLTEGVICGGWGGEAVSGGAGWEGSVDAHGESELVGLLK